MFSNWVVSFKNLGKDGRSWHNWNSVDSTRIGVGRFGAFDVIFASYFLEFHLHFVSDLGISTPRCLFEIVSTETCFFGMCFWLRSRPPPVKREVPNSRILLWSLEG